MEQGTFPACLLLWGYCISFICSIRCLLLLQMYLVARAGHTSDALLPPDRFCQPQACQQVMVHCAC